MDIKRIALRMKIRKVGGSVVHHCAILRKLLAEIGIKTKIIKGFCVSPGDVCEHYWVRTDDEGLDMDIGFEIAKLYTPELGDLQTMLLEKIPDDLSSVTVLKQEDNARLYDLHESDVKTFWAESPFDVRTFRP